MKQLDAAASRDDGMADPGAYGRRGRRAAGGVEQGGVCRGCAKLRQSEIVFASREPHSRIFVADRDSIYLRDLASRNHTFLNDEPIREAVLRNGDVIGLDRSRSAVRAVLIGHTSKVRCTRRSPSCGWNRMTAGFRCLAAPRNRQPNGLRYSSSRPGC